MLALFLILGKHFNKACVSKIFQGGVDHVDGCDKDDRKEEIEDIWQDDFQKLNFHEKSNVEN